jgi:hypothetical protein
MYGLNLNSFYKLDQTLINKKNRINKRKGDLDNVE